MNYNSDVQLPTSLLKEYLLRLLPHSQYLNRRPTS